MESNELDVRAQSSKFGYEASSWGTPGRFCQRNTRRSGCGNGNGARITPCTTLNIAEFAPIPSAIVSTATQVNPGFRISVRRLKRMSRVRVSRVESGILQYLIFECTSSV